jgi:hypothetical protein
MPNPATSTPSSEPARSDRPQSRDRKTPTMKVQQFYHDDSKGNDAP